MAEDYRRVLDDNYLSLAELACHDADRTPYPVQWRDTRLVQLAKLFGSLRHYMGHPLIVSSGYRTPEHQAKLVRSKTGARNSQHVQGRAVDVATPRGRPVAQFHQEVRVWAKDEPLLGGLGFYSWGIHLDCRQRKNNRLASWGRNRVEA
ncbi:MAG: D-Ala-D-Ala carboxypeptidase family metallohydrolase [Bryobacterales bacterium]|nr:D-Ala-D-Ala carboxypeptidase family metallohydrolase [Bryobacterales bacterium]